jgi:hypothetical protein
MRSWRLGELMVSDTRTYVSHQDNAFCTQEKTWSVPGSSSWASTIPVIYVNDLPLSVQEAMIVLFADGTNMSLTAETGCVLQHKVEL